MENWQLTMKMQLYLPPNTTVFKKYHCFCPKIKLFLAKILLYLPQIQCKYHCIFPNDHCICPKYNWICPKATWFSPNFSCLYSTVFSLNNSDDCIYKRVDYKKWSVSRCAPPPAPLAAAGVLVSSIVVEPWDVRSANMRHKQHWYKILWKKYAH